MSRNWIKVSIYTNQTTLEIKFPARWSICQSCDGEGTSCAHVECDGGGFTASEWAEQDDEFREDYLAGIYDRPCPSCHGRGSVKGIDVEHIVEYGGWRQRTLLKAYLAQEADAREIDAISAAERRMGA